MQKILAVILLLISFSCINSTEAQSGLCAGVTSSVFPMNPQSGQYNYFGIAITLDQVYGQDITVTGYIYDDGSFDTNHPFSITVTAGNTTTSTAATFYQTGPTSSGAISVSVISPSNVTASSVSYSTQCSLTGYPPVGVVTNANNPLDYVGSYHNIGCTSIFSQVDTTLAIVPQILHYTKLFLQSNSYDSSAFNSWYSSAVANNYYNLASSKNYNAPDSIIDMYYAQSLISLAVKNYLEQMIYKIDSIVGNNTPTQALYNTVTSQIISIENNIVNNTSLSSNEINGLLSTASVLRFSGALWASYILNNGGGFSYLRPTEKMSYSFEQTSLLSDNTWTSSLLSSDESISFNRYFTDNAKFPVLDAGLFGWNWKKIWHGDVAGAIGGFFGGLFTGGGVIGSTIGGAIGGSVAAVFFQNDN